MKITEIKKVDNMFYITEKPNKFEKFLGCETKLKRFKMTLAGYIYNEEGEVLNHNNYYSKEIKKFIKKF